MENEKKKTLIIFLKNLIKFCQKAQNKNLNNLPLKPTTKSNHESPPLPVPMTRLPLHVPQKSQKIFSRPTITCLT